MGIFLKYLGVFFLASVKYLIVAVPLAAASKGLWYVDMLVVMAGGCFGVFFFTLLSEKLQLYFKRKNIFQPTFKRLRKYVKLKNNAGLLGISIISPVLISIPVGCFLSAAIENSERKVLLYQCSSVIIWSLVFFGSKAIFGFSFNNLF